MDGVLNSDVLLKVQSIQLEILIEFDNICKKHNLSYQLFAGTLLGAVRHKGFIPWDDDIDVVMPRKDYKQFINMYNNFETDYFLQNYYTDPEFYRQFSRLRKNDTLYIQEVYKDLEIHQGIFIDIFPLDNVRVNSIVEKMRLRLLSLFFKLNIIRNRKKITKKHNNFKKKFIKFIKKCTNLIISKPVYDEIGTKILTLFNKNNTDYLNHLTNGVTENRFDKYLISKNDYYNTIEWEFENHTFPIPENYDKVLSNLYGDYMKLPPKELQKPHHGIIKVKHN